MPQRVKQSVGNHTASKCWSWHSNLVVWFLLWHTHTSKETCTHKKKERKTLFGTVTHQELQKQHYNAAPRQNVSYLYIHLINVHCWVVSANYRESTSVLDSEPLEANELGSQPCLPESRAERSLVTHSENRVFWCHITPRTVVSFDIHHLT